METRQGFTLMSIGEFENWIVRQQVARTVRHLQQHHTFLPAYPQFTGANHFALQLGMKHHHVTNNGWADIGQHFSTFPDGTIMTGRSLEQSPACIKGNNAHGVCLEHVGNFDIGRDVMRDAHRLTIIRMSAAICRRFAIPITTDHVVYHHWFDLDSGARTDGTGVTKSCPGTAWFGGNTVDSARRNFLPKVRAALEGDPVPVAVEPRVGFVVVTADTLNVRKRPEAGAAKVGVATLGSVLRVHASREGWLRISVGNQEWVSGRFTAPVERATVKASTLNVRSAPDKDAPRVTSVARGQELFIHERRNGWCRIGLEDRWVAELHLTDG